MVAPPGEGAGVLLRVDDVGGGDCEETAESLEEEVGVVSGVDDEPFGSPEEDVGGTGGVCEAFGSGFGGPCLLCGPLSPDPRW